MFSHLFRFSLQSFPLVGALFRRFLFPSFWCLEFPRCPWAVLVGGFKVVPLQTRRSGASKLCSLILLDMNMSFPVSSITFHGSVRFPTRFNFVFSSHDQIAHFSPVSLRCAVVRMQKLILAALGLLALIVIVDGTPHRLFNLGLQASLTKNFFLQLVPAPTLRRTAVRLFATSLVANVVSVCPLSRFALVTTCVAPSVDFVFLC